MGRKQYEKVTVISANPSYNMKYIQATSFASVPSASSLDINVFAPAGTVCEVENAYIAWYKNGALETSGQKTIVATVAGGLIGWLYGRYAFNNDLVYRYGLWEGTTVQTYPTDGTAMQLQQKVAYDENDGLTFKFDNQTNVADGGMEKRVRLWVRETKII